MSIQFISNNNQNHFTQLNNLIQASDEVWMATAFLKQSGLNKLLPSIKKHIETNKAISIIAGQNFGLTEPKALIELYKLFKKTSNAKLYLANANKPTEVFHPKLYLFRKNDDFTILSGSANLTEGGLQTNIECSLLIKANRNDNVWKEALLFFSKVLSSGCSQEATLSIIKQYESYYEQQKQINRQAKSIPTRLKSQINFNNNLVTLFNKYDNSERETIFRNRIKDYTEARQVLDKIANDDELTEEKYIDLIDKLAGKAGSRRLWHSGSLHRKKSKTYSYYKEFQGLVRYIKSHSHDSPASVFSKAKDMVSKIEGAGINYITEIMMTYNPEEFANLNINPVTVLKEKGGLNIKKIPFSYNGIDYQEYCEIIKEINKKLGLKNMLESDSFFNDIYWDLPKF